MNCPVCDRMLCRLCEEQKDKDDHTPKPSPLESFKKRWIGSGEDVDLGYLDDLKTA